MAKAADKPNNPAILFQDRAYKTRTIVLPDGRTFMVEKRQILADDATLIEYLDAHADFERQAAEG